MKSYIKAIILFDKDGEKRTVPLTQGVNIITGQSKTGKSALVEIIDYCLCSTRCTIPKGRITDFAVLYALVIVINEHTYIVARQKWEDGNKMFFSKEDRNYSADQLELDYFSRMTPLPPKEAQTEIECALGLLVTNMASTDDDAGKKASLRNMVSYMFQHQNLMASKFALFYRFSDYYKRKDVIEQFPVFAGIIGQEYYSDLIQLGNLKSQLKRKYKKQKTNEKSTAYIRENLTPLIKDYYALLGRDFNEGMPVQKMIRLASELPEYDDSQLFGQEKITERYNALNTQLEGLRDEEREILLRIQKLENVSDTGKNFSDMLKELKQQTDIAEIANVEYVCPLCGHDCREIAEADLKIVEAAEWLDQELQLTEKYTSDFSEERRELNEIHSQIGEQIRDVWRQIKTIEKKFISSKELVSNREKINYAKAKIMLYAEMSSSGIFETVDEDIQDLEQAIKALEEKIKGFDVEAKKARAQVFLSNNMNRLAKTLDFEKEYQPINLNFGLLDETFDIYQHQNGREKIYLYEMGSGANWVSCHIALFLSFLHYFSTQEKSPMPLIMFFDQPSQVYFPQGDKAASETTPADITAVSKMYKTIFDEINLIGANTGILPQIIIVDHVDGKDLDCKDEFNAYVRCNWRNGKALV
ncbi:MAG: DUF3732 domain-containing protein [Oscillospiraceae bacterium]|nr:DUF3732 domain-containing protein [Oscillospiraceae bacterium]